MHDQPMSQPGRDLHVRPEITESVVRLLYGEAECLRRSADANAQELSGTFDRLAAAIRGGDAIAIGGYPTLPNALLADGFGYKGRQVPPYSTASELILCVRSKLSGVSEDGTEAHDWCYLGDLAALAADIEAVFAPSPTTATVEPVR